MTQLLLVAGSWGSGTTSVIGALHHLGVPTLGPYFQSNDPKTVNTYELESFRNLVLSYVNEANLQFTENYANDFLPALQEFKNNVEQQLPADKNFFALKLPLSSMCLPEICQVFDTTVIMVHRPFGDVENSRLRREWPPIYGQQGAQVMYSKMISDLITMKKSFYGLSYADFLAEPERRLKEILEFSGIEALETNIPAALEYIRN